MPINTIRYPLHGPLHVPTASQKAIRKQNLTEETQSSTSWGAKSGAFNRICCPTFFTVPHERQMDSH